MSNCCLQQTLSGGCTHAPAVPTRGFLELAGCILWPILVSFFWNSGSRECVVQALCGSEDQSTGVVCNSRLRCPLAMANSQVPGSTKVNILIVFEAKTKKTKQKKHPPPKTKNTLLVDIVSASLGNLKSNVCIQCLLLLERYK